MMSESDGHCEWLHCVGYGLDSSASPEYTTAGLAEQQGRTLVKVAGCLLTSRDAGAKVARVPAPTLRVFNASSDLAYYAGCHTLWS